MSLRWVGRALVNLAAAALTGLVAWSIVALAVTAGPPWSYALVGVCLIILGAWIMASARWQP